MKRLILALLLLSQTTTATAAYLVKGVGGLTCQRYVADYRKAGFARREQRSWILGFITGMNFNDKEMRDRGSDLYAEQIDDWILNYCLEHPAEKLHTAAELFARELEKVQPGQLKKYQGRQ